MALSSGPSSGAPPSHPAEGGHLLPGRPRFREGHDPEVFLAEQAAARYPLFRSVDPIELATDDVAPSALVDAALDALVGRGREGLTRVVDPVGDIIGDYRAFAATQQARLAASGIDIAPYALSHLAYRVPDWDQYVHLRMLLERQATANLENVWNGRPISKILLAKPLEVLDGALVPMIELIPPSTSASTGWAWSTSAS